MRKLIFFSILMASLQAIPAHAYIGPGAGAGAIAVVLGVLGSIFLALAGIIWYPFKRLLKAIKSASKKAIQKDETNEMGADNSNVHNSSRIGSSNAPHEDSIGD
ncbi:MAG: hypothetical protein P8Y63_10155 [Deltaproteobacteria bacterium]